MGLALIGGVEIEKTFLTWGNRCGNISLVSKTCGRGGTADALASGASGGNLVVVQIHSTAPIKN